MKEYYEGHYGEWKAVDVKIDPQFPSIIIYLSENILLGETVCFVKKGQDWYKFKDFEYILKNDGHASIKTLGNISNYDLIRVIFFKIDNQKEEHWEIVNGEWAQV